MQLCLDGARAEEPKATAAADEGRNTIEDTQLEDAGAADSCDRREDAEGRGDRWHGAPCVFGSGLASPSSRTCQADGSSLSCAVTALL